jgi:D-alanyl-D-alanine carboxypeptidase
MLQGSVGKTYFAAVAMQLVSEGKLNLDDPIARWLGEEPWFERLPNGRAVTVRMLMNHTSGIVRYEMKPEFTRDLTAAPDKVWTAEERIAYVLGETPPFEAGKGWTYSDTNYILLGMILERVTGRTLYDEVRRRVLEPLGLRNTVPSDSRVIPGLVQGYAGANNPFGGSDAVLIDGRFVVNPQFEWAGGGFASSAEDLARWAKLLYEGKAYDPELVKIALTGVEARGLGQGAQYGLGVIIRPTPLGVSWGHSGFFPGYLTEMRYYPDHGFSIALQVNTSAGRPFPKAPSAVLQDLAQIVADELRR